ncbi:MAG: YitT family protein [Clostridium sp.]
MMNQGIQKYLWINKININARAKQIFMILLGGLIYSISVNLFIVPNKLLSGGVAGIALLFQYVTKIPSGVFTLIINIPIFALGFKLIDKEFGILSFIGMMSMSFFLIVTENVSKYIVVDDILIASICGGVLCGIGMSIIFLNRASEGGTDIIAIIFKKKYGIKLSSICFILNSAIVFTGLLLNNLTITIYTIISLFIRSAILDKAINSVNERSLMIVISDNYEDIKCTFLNALGRGVTFLQGEGAYTGEKKKIIYTIMSPKQVEEAKKMVLDIDPKSVVTIMNVCEAHGKGFKQLTF